MSIAKKFANMWLEKSCHQTSSTILDAYEHTLQWLRSNPHTTGFDQKGVRPDLDDGTPFGIANHFYWYFETHFFKAQKSLMLSAVDTEKYQNASWLDQPYLSVLDIGCGTGAGTLALLDLLSSYYEFRNAEGLPQIETNISIVAIDPCKFALDTYCHITQYLKPGLEEKNITFSVCFIEDEFPHPDCISKIVNNWEPAYPYTLLGISSNVIRPLQNQLERVQSLISASGITEKFNLGQVLASAYDQIITKYGFQQIVIQDIATRNVIRKGFNLFDALKGLWNLIREFLGSKPMYIWKSKETEQNIIFKNSPNSYFGQNGQGDPVGTIFLQEMHIGQINDQYSDQLWVKAISLSNLELAWARSRNFILHEDIVDEIEIKLVDIFWQEYLHRLKLYLDAGDTSRLNQKNLVNYLIPKNEEEDRPKYSLRLNEQLICAAISQAMPEAYHPINKDHILGNRLNPEPNEFFYEPWFNQFNDYSKSIKLAAEKDKIVGKTDLKSYYTNIRQSDLYKLLSQLPDVQSSAKTQIILKLILLRQLINPPHGQNKGLPQSGITAGLWSSTFLRNVDNAILTKLGKQNSFYRYADDMAIISPGDELDSILEYIQSELDKLGLLLNPKKTFRFQAADYITRFTDDTRLGILSKKVRKILESIYFLSAEYKSVYSVDKNGFLDTYSRLLSSIHIHMAVDWLNRKIVSRGSWLHWLQHIFRGIVIQYPSFPQDRLSLSTWKIEFEKLNPYWIKLRDEVITELVALFGESWRTISLSQELDDVDYNKAKRALKFSAYRLAIFGINPISDLLSNLLSEKPGLLSPKILLKALVDDNCIDTVLNLGQQWKQRTLPLNKDGQPLNSASFLSASTCWALGFCSYRDDVQIFLYEVLESKESTVTEKLMASEALIRIGYPNLEKNPTIFNLLSDDQHVCVKRNLLLLLNLNTPDKINGNNIDIKKYMAAYAGFTSAIQYVISNNLNIFSVKEPSILENYYSRWYPDLPADLQKTNSSPELFAIQ